MTTHTSRHSQTSSDLSHATSRKDTQMSEKNSSASSPSTQESAGNMQVPWNLLADLGRQQLAMKAEMTSALCRGIEAVRRIQQETAQQASARHGEVVQKLKGSCQPADLLALQSELLRLDLQSAGQYWQQLAVVALQTQKEMMGSMSHMLSRENGGGVKSAMQALQSVIPPMASSFYVLSHNSESEHH